MNIIIKQDYAELSLEAARIIADLVKAKPSCGIGLIAGATPSGLYKELVLSYKNKGLDFSKVMFFGLDEYLGFEMDLRVEYKLDLSFERFIFEEFIKHIGIPKENFIMPKIKDGDVSGSCLEFEKRITESGGIDLQLLGIGANGHIGFNEPGSSFDSRTRIVKLDDETLNSNFNKSISALQSHEIPHYAVTAGIGTILEAEKILLLATGEGKADIIKEALQGKPSSDVPASFLQRVSEKLTVIIDKKAAQNLD